MPDSSSTELRHGGIRDATVQGKTGRNWRQWCGLLDSAGAKTWSHQQTVRYLASNHGLSAWWSQMVTVGYEQAIGRRKPGELLSGFAANVSRTYEVSDERLFTAWIDVDQRLQWLGINSLTIRSSRPHKIVRLVRGGQATAIDVQFFAKSGGRCQMTIQERKLADAKAAARARRFWKEILDQLEAYVTS